MRIEVLDNRFPQPQRFLDLCLGFDQAEINIGFRVAAAMAINAIGRQQRSDIGFEVLGTQPSRRQASNQQSHQRCQPLCTCRNVFYTENMKLFLTGRRQQHFTPSRKSKQTCEPTANRNICSPMIGFSASLFYFRNTNDACADECLRKSNGVASQDIQWLWAVTGVISRGPLLIGFLIHCEPTFWPYFDLRDL